MKDEAHPGVVFGAAQLNETGEISLFFSLKLLNKDMGAADRGHSNNRLWLITDRFKKKPKQSV